MAGNGKDDHMPVVRTGRIGISGPILVPQVEWNVENFLSRSNRRLYRQSRIYHPKIDLDVDATQTLNVYVLNDSWMTLQALRLAYSKYEENAASEKEDLKDNQVARWEDFRTQSGTNYQSLEPAQYNIVGPAVPGTVLVPTGEFTISFVVDADGVTRSFTWGVPSTSRYGILDEYDKAGNANPSPNTSTGDMPYDDLMSDDSGAMAGYLQTRGNLPPYDKDGVNTAMKWVKVATLGTGATQKLSTGFFKAPCGFVIITAGAGQDEIVDVTKLQWSVKAGDYKGVHAPSMLE